MSRHRGTGALAPRRRVEGDGWRTCRLDGHAPDTAIDYDVPEGGEILLLGLPMAPLEASLAAHMVAARSALEPLFGPSLQDPLLAETVRRIWLAAARDDVASTLFVDSAAMMLVSALLGRAGVPVPRLPSGAGARMQTRIAEYVEAHLDQPIGLDDLARVANLSAFHFHRSFRQVTGLTPHQYVTARRVERAKRLLAGDMALAQVAFACGFASQSHFGQVFKAATGATPGQWRAEVGG